jgi:hypothetical protein
VRKRIEVQLLIDNLRGAMLNAHEDSIDLCDRVLRRGGG